MAHLIDKDTLVAKITAFKEDAYRTWKWDTFHTLKELLSFINTLKVKEVDDKGKWKNTGGFGSTFDPDSSDYCPD